MAKINCFIPVQEKSQVIATVEGLKSSELVSKIYLLATEDFSDAIEGCEVVKIDSLQSSATVKKIAELSDAEYSLIYTCCRCGLKGKKLYSCDNELND